MKRFVKNQKGITLIALIITIIVMLILVAVTINVALNGGIFNKAKDASDKTQLAIEREELQSLIISKMDVSTSKIPSDLGTITTGGTTWEVTAEEVEGDIIITLTDAQDQTNTKTYNAEDDLKIKGIIISSNNNGVTAQKNAYGFYEGSIYYVSFSGVEAEGERFSIITITDETNATGKIINKQKTVGEEGVDEWEEYIRVVQNPSYEIGGETIPLTGWVIEYTEDPTHQDYEPEYIINNDGSLYLIEYNIYDSIEIDDSVKFQINPSLIWDEI